MSASVYFALILMGFTSLIVQTIFIREFLVSFYGNELTIGLILANWIILEALGSWLFSKISLKIKHPYLIYAFLQIGIALYLPISIFLIRDIKNILGVTSGEGVGVAYIFLSSLFIIFPLSILDGAEFPFGCRILEEKNIWQATAKVYILEAIGFIIAGLIFIFLILKGLNSFLIVLYLALLNLLSAFLLLKLRKIKLLYSILGSILIMLLILHPFLADKLHIVSLKKQWKNQEVLNYQNSLYANLAVIKTQEQLTLYSNGIPIITLPNPNISFIEDIVHFSLLSCPYPKKVLILGSGVGGIIKEIIKHPVEKIIYVEIDPKIIDLVSRFPIETIKEELKEPRLEIKYIDARRFLKNNLEKFDVIILNLPIPTTLQLNRFYTKEFFKELKLHLTEEGIFIFPLPGSLSYLSKELVKLNSLILKTLEEVFFVNIIPGEINFYLAAKKYFKISPMLLSERIKERIISTKLFNQNYLEYRLNRYWSDWFINLVKKTEIKKINSDILPLATFYSILYWNSIFSKEFSNFFAELEKITSLSVLGFLLFFVLILLFILKFYRKREIALFSSIFSTGFWTMSLELILIYFYQIVFGLIFSHLALLTTSFMLGLTLGGIKARKIIDTFSHKKEIVLNIEKKMVFLTIILWPLFIFLNQQVNPLYSLVFFILSAMIGYLGGKEFPLINKIYLTKNKLTGVLYALDLSGAYFASILISLVFVPILGVLFTLIFLVLLKGISVGLLKLSTSDI